MKSLTTKLFNKSIGAIPKLMYRPMSRSIAKFFVMNAAVVALLSLCAPPAVAAGTYDGNWVFDFPAAGGITAEGQARCPAFRVPVRITDNQISGSLGRAGSGVGSGSLRSGGSGTRTSPVTGSVAADGSVKARWENYALTGKLSGGGQGELTTVRGQCGPRKGTAVRVGQ